jgi:hypothetical protein
MLPLKHQLSIVFGAFKSTLKCRGHIETSFVGDVGCPELHGMIVGPNCSRLHGGLDEVERRDIGLLLQAQWAALPCLALFEPSMRSLPAWHVNSCTANSSLMEGGVWGAGLCTVGL